MECQRDVGGAAAPSARPLEQSLRRESCVAGSRAATADERGADAPENFFLDLVAGV